MERIVGFLAGGVKNKNKKCNNQNGKEENEQTLDEHRQRTRVVVDGKVTIDQTEHFHFGHDGHQHGPNE